MHFLFAVVLSILGYSIIFLMTNIREMIESGQYGALVLLFVGGFALYYAGVISERYKHK